MLGGRRRRFAGDVSRKNLLEAQTAVLKADIKLGLYQTVVVKLHLSLGETTGDFEVHSVTTASEGPVVLLVHGTMGSAATSWSKVGLLLMMVDGHRRTHMRSKRSTSRIPCTHFLTCPFL
jgi:hypothetical protein